MKSDLEPWAVYVQRKLNKFDNNPLNGENIFEGLPVNATYMTKKRRTEVIAGFSAGMFAGYPAEIRTFKVNGKDKMLVEIDYNDKNRGDGMPSIIFLIVDCKGDYEVISLKNINSEIEKDFGISFDELIQQLEYDYFDGKNIGGEVYGLGHYMMYPERISKYPPIIPHVKAKEIMDAAKEKEQERYSEDQRVAIDSLTGSDKSRND